MPPNTTAAFKKQLAPVRGQPILSLSGALPSQGVLITVRSTPCHVQVYGWGHHLGTLQLPSDPTCVEIEGEIMYIGCRSGKVYRADVSGWLGKARSRCSAPVLRLEEDNVWAIHRGVRFCKVSSAGLILCGDIDAPAMYSLRERRCLLARLGPLATDDAAISVLTCLTGESPRRGALWAELFGPQEAILKAPVAVVGGSGGSVAWMSLADAGQGASGQLCTPGSGQGVGAVVGVFGVTVQEAEAVVVIRDCGHVAILGSRATHPRQAGMLPHCSRESRVRAMSRVGDGQVAYLVGQRAFVIRLDALLRPASLPPRPLAAHRLPCPRDVVALGASEQYGTGVVLLTSSGRLLGLPLAPSGPLPLPSPSSLLPLLDAAVASTRRLEHHLSLLGLELERASQALPLVQSRAGSLAYRLQIHHTNPADVQSLTPVLHLLNTSPSPLPLDTWHVLLSLTLEANGALAFLSSTAGGPPSSSVVHTFCLPLCDLSPSATLTLPVPLRLSPLPLRLHYRLTLLRPSPAALSPRPCPLPPPFLDHTPHPHRSGVSIDLTSDGTLDLLDLCPRPPLPLPQCPLPTLAGLRELRTDLQEHSHVASCNDWQPSLLRLVTAHLPAPPGPSSPPLSPHALLTWTLPSYTRAWRSDDDADAAPRGLSGLVGPVDGGPGLMVGADDRALLLLRHVSTPVLVRLSACVDDVGADGPPLLHLSSHCPLALAEVQAALRRRLQAHAHAAAHPLEMGPAAAADPPSRGGQHHLARHRGRLVGPSAIEALEAAEREVRDVIAELEGYVRGNPDGGGTPSPIITEAGVGRAWTLLLRAVRVFEQWSREQGNGREAHTVFMK